MKRLIRLFVVINSNLAPSFTVFEIRRLIVENRQFSTHPVPGPDLAGGRPGKGLAIELQGFKN